MRRRRNPLPEWVPVAKQQLAERLATVNVTPVEIKVEPAGADVKLAVSLFAPDELFGPRTIHLPPGRHVIIATAPGYNDAQKTVEVGDDRTPQTVTITMLPIGAAKVGPPSGGAVPETTRTSSKVPLAVMAAGGGVLVVGAALHLFYFKPVRDDLGGGDGPRHVRPAVVEVRHPPDGDDRDVWRRRGDRAHRPAPQADRVQDRGVSRPALGDPARWRRHPERRVAPVTAAADSNPPGELYCTACEKTFHRGDRCPTDGTRLIKLKARIDPFLGRDIDGRFTDPREARRRWDGGGVPGRAALGRSRGRDQGRELGLISEPEVIKRFLREAKLASRLSHPNAVGVLDFGQTDDGVFYLVLELVSGRTLDDVIKAERTFKPERVVRIGVQICDALEGAHELSDHPPRSQALEHHADGVGPRPGEGPRFRAREVDVGPTRPRRR